MSLNHLPGKKANGWRSLLAGILALLLLAGCAGTPQNESEEDKVRAEINQIRKETLQMLYAEQPKAKKQVQDAAGYAVFSNVGLQFFFLGGGHGYGVAMDNDSGKKTYMKMVELQAGLGLGVKKFRHVWVFEGTGKLDEFINTGWEFGGQATAAAKAGKQGGDFAGAISVSPGVWLYQLTDDGLTLELTATGTKYYKDDVLND